MTLSYNLILSRLSAAVLPGANLAQLGAEVAETFRRATQSASYPEGRIVLTVQTPPPLYANITVLDLPTAVSELERLTQNRPPLPIQNIAVIYADRWKYNQNNLFGLMFDANRGEAFGVGVALNDPSVARNHFPREGCAVFVGTLQSHQYDTLDHIRRTTIHKLGHVFNLGHHKNTRTVDSTLMSQTRRGMPWAAFSKFANRHTEFLLGPDEPRLRPGDMEFDPFEIVNDLGVG